MEYEQNHEVCPICHRLVDLDGDNCENVPDEEGGHHYQHIDCELAALDSNTIIAHAAA